VQGCASTVSSTVLSEEIQAVDKPNVVYGTLDHASLTTREQGFAVSR
jgi:hypothetical protein